MVMFRGATSTVHVRCEYLWIPVGNPTACGVMFEVRMNRQTNNMSALLFFIYRILLDVPI
jgi:hypothetical protein